LSYQAGRVGPPWIHAPAVVVDDDVERPEQVVPRHPVLEQPALVAYDDSQHEAPLPLQGYLAARWPMPHPIPQPMAMARRCERRARGEATRQHLQPQLVQRYAARACSSLHRSLDAVRGVAAEVPRAIVIHTTDAIVEMHTSAAPADCAPKPWFTAAAMVLWRQLVEAEMDRRVSRAWNNAR